MAASISPLSVETEGNEVSTSFQADEDVRRHAKFWAEVVEAEHLQDKDVYDLLGWSKGYYSKVASGSQGDLLGMVFLVGQRRPDLRRAFIARLAEHEELDPVAVAAEQMVIAAMRVIRTVRGGARMAKANVAEKKQRGAA